MKTIPAFLIMIVCGAALFAQETENNTAKLFKYGERDAKRYIQQIILSVSR